MTVAGLWGLLKQRGLVRSACGAEARELLEGKIVAIDVSCWAVQGITVENSVAARCQHFLAMCFWRLIKYLRLGCFPVAVIEGDCPKIKRRRRDRNGEFQRSIKLIGELFSAMGCPMVEAAGEAEETCTKLSRAGLVDGILSPDSDVFPFGAQGLVFKAVHIDSMWCVEYVDAQAVSAIMGFNQQGWIALSALAGCDFLPAGGRGIGAEKALDCVHALLKHCGNEALLKECLLSAVDAGLPNELCQFASLTGCQTCRKCGHGDVGKPKHGTLGCIECKTTKAQGGNGGCLPRLGECPCDFHRNHDSVVLARVFASRDSLPRSTSIKAAWRVYEGTPVDPMDFTWKRPSLEATSRLLSTQCGIRKIDTIKYMLPAVLVYDILHPDDRMFEPSEVIGECFVGLSPSDKQSQSKALAVLKWVSRQNVSEDLVHLANELPRPKRCISKSLALRHCHGLVEQHCKAQLLTKMSSTNLRKPLKSTEHWISEAHALCCESWGLLEVPAAITADIDLMAAKWNEDNAKTQQTLRSFFKPSQL